MMNSRHWTVNQLLQQAPLGVLPHAVNGLGQEQETQTSTTTAAAVGAGAGAVVATILTALWFLTHKPSPASYVETWIDASKMPISTEAGEWKYINGKLYQRIMSKVVK